MIPWLREVICGPTTPVPLPPSALPAEPADTPEGVFHAAALRFLELQVSTNDVLDTRNAGIFSVGSTVLPLTFGLLSLGDNDVPQRALVPLGGALLFYFCLIACSWWASRYRGLEFRPDIVALSEISDDYPSPLLQRWVALEYASSVESNERTLLRKGRWVGVATTLLYAEGVCLSVAALLTLDPTVLRRLWESAGG